MFLKKFFIKLTFIFVLFLILSIFYLFTCYKNGTLPRESNLFIINNNSSISSSLRLVHNTTYNIWCILTKVEKNSVLQFKFRGLIKSILDTTNNSLHFHVICDEFSKVVATKILDKLFSNSTYNKNFVFYSFYDVTESANVISDIVDTMTPFFSSRPGTYYSDALFYLSLGLHRIAPLSQNEAVMLDCDIKFTRDISFLYREFDSFKPTNLFGLSHELTPVYRHILYNYRSKTNTTFGDPIHSNPINTGENYHPFGFPGYNSGVMLFNLKEIRKSINKYNYLISKKNVERLTNKYKFRGHLGDQDYYTLLGYEYPEIFHTLPCGFNRQLCTWWRDHGYKDVFNDYYTCDGDVFVYHGNCNSPFPV